MFKNFIDDMESIKKRDPAARSYFEIWLTYAGYRAVRDYRLAHWFYKRKMFLLARIISQVSRFFTGIEIHPGAKIGKGLFIDHGMGVVIGETAEIGDNCILYQGVTLGGTGKEKGKRHPTLGDNVMVGAGAKVLGPFNVGNNVKIAANAVVLNEIKDNCTVAGIPARVARCEGKKVAKEQDLDQINIPDPIEKKFKEIYKALRELGCNIDNEQ